MPPGTAQSGQVRAKRPSSPGLRPPAQERLPSVGRASPTWRYLPHALVVTFATVVLPLLLVELLELLTGERSIFLSIALAVALSAAIATAGSWLWQRMPASRDILFGDLMVLGFVRRVRAERRLSEVTRLLRTDPLSPDGVRSTREERIQILERLARSLEARDPFMLGHSRRVARSAQMVAERMGLPPELVTKVQIAASVHDTGKINTPARILNKPGALTDEEFEVIRRHPGDGADMLEPLGDPEIMAMVRHHHERLDGSGYPDGLAGDEIPLGARIIAVADTFDAITSVRPYRPPRKQQAALRILKEDAGARLDPQVVATFLSCYSGRRTAAWSSLAVAAPERFVGVLTGGGAGPLTQGAAATLALAGLGGAFVNPALERDAPPAKVAASPDRGPPELRHGHTAARAVDDRLEAGRHGRSRKPSGSGDVDRQATRTAPDGTTGGSPPTQPVPAGGSQPTSPTREDGPADAVDGGTVAELRQTLLDLLRSRGGDAPALPEPPALPGAPELPSPPGL
jgi:HD-GYP domain-containing protein (c-di-GMP phosphodiesterase class II)